MPEPTGFIDPHDLDMMRRQRDLAAAELAEVSDLLVRLSAEVAADANRLDRLTTDEKELVYQALRFAVFADNISWTETLLQDCPARLKN